jgi:hypothetical protein
LILPHWSSCTVDGIAVGSLMHTLNCILVWLPLWTLVGKMFILPTIETGSSCYCILSNIVSLWWWRCRARRLKIITLDLTLRSLESLRCNLHPLLLTRTENRSLRRTITELLVASLSSSALHFPLAFHDSSLIFKD